MAGDCYGDAVNVAARLLDHAGDNETLITAEVLQGLTLEQRSRFRSLDRLVLRGRVEPVQVHVMGGRRGSSFDMPATQFGGDISSVSEPDGLRLVWRDMNRVFASQQMPVVLGRSPQASFCVDDSRVSRSHARVDWHSGSFQLTDLSYNGTYVQFADGEIVSLRRGSCTLHGNGVVGLGGSPSDPGSACVRFDVLRFGDTQPLLSPDLMARLTAAHPPCACSTSTTTASTPCSSKRPAASPAASRCRPPAAAPRRWNSSADFRPAGAGGRPAPARHRRLRAAARAAALPAATTPRRPSCARPTSRRKCSRRHCRPDSPGCWTKPVDLNAVLRRPGRAYDRRHDIPRRTRLPPRQQHRARPCCW